MVDCFEKVVTAAQENLDETFYELQSDNFPGMDGASWRLSKYPLKGGKQAGTQVVELDNGTMNLVVLPTRGMSILEALTDRFSLGWTSPVRQVVHPAYVDEESRGGLGWLEGFNEMMVRCGLSYNGAPGEDEVLSNTGEPQSVALPLHGTIANSPASRVALRVGMEPPHELAVAGQVEDAQMFGSRLRLSTTVSTAPGTTRFTVSDRVENLGGTAAEMELLYHCNFGRPLLGEGARLMAPLQFLCPRDARAGKGLSEWDVFGPPEGGFAEQVYFMRLHGDEEGGTVVALVNPDQSTAVSIRFSTFQLPAFTLWKNTAAEADGYVTGLEPGTDYPNNRSFERQNGRVVELEAGEAYQACLTFELVEGAADVAGLVEEIDSLAGGEKTEVSEEPMPEYCPQ